MTDNPLGKHTVYPQTYNPSLLFPVSRQENRERIGILSERLPFFGFDHWRGYELSWLQAGGKPTAVLADILVPCDSPFLVESKSMKLYFNSLNQHSFDTMAAAQVCMTSDLSKAAGAPVQVVLHDHQSHLLHTEDMSDIVLLDDLDIQIESYQPDPGLLTTEDVTATEALGSHLFRSNCPITSQPDWGSIVIRYRGRRINHQSLLAYIVSYRQHEGFHEHCVEQIFQEIMQMCAPDQLTVSINFLRRGGLEINPLRSTGPVSVEALPRLLRQ
jgi:7-cyano-7-deazaguanine reductase